MQTHRIPAELAIRDAIPAGFEAVCPLCQGLNFSPFTSDGRLIWYPNSQHGTWCTHTLGCYAGESPEAPTFLFRLARTERPSAPTPYS